METTATMTNEKMNEIYSNIDFCRSVKNAHICTDKNGVFKHKKTCSYPISYIVTDEQIEEAAKEYNRVKDAFISNMKKNVLYFVGMGCNFEKSEFSDIENYRIRAYFQNNKKELFFVEFSGTERSEIFYCNHSISFPDGNIEEEKNNNFFNLERETLKGYTKENILKIVNHHFNCNFEAVEIEKHFYLTENISKSN